MSPSGDGDSGRRGDPIGGKVVAVEGLRRVSNDELLRIEKRQRDGPEVEDCELLLVESVFVVVFLEGVQVHRDNESF